jgi:hypothetical protein
MRILLSTVWLALAGIFFGFGWQLWGQANRPLPELEATEPKFEISGESFRFEIGVEGTPLDEPFREFRSQVDAHLTELGDSVGRTQRRAALACGAAGLASLASLIVVWMRPASQRTSAQ